MAERIVYCAIEDIQSLIKRVQFSDTSKVTTSDIAKYIRQVSNLVDGELRKLGVTLPISTSATSTLEVLKLLVSYEVGSMAETIANFGANKNESGYGKWLHDRYLELLEQIKSNPQLLPDIVVGGINYMKSSTEDMNDGEINHGNEIFTKEHIDDFRDDNKIYTHSEDVSDSETITGDISRRI